MQFLMESGCNIRYNSNLLILLIDRIIFGYAYFCKTCREVPKMSKVPKMPNILVSLRSVIFL